MSLPMDVYRAYHANGQPRKDWAVAIQNGEVVTRWGKSGGALQGGEPVQRMGKTAFDVKCRLTEIKERGPDKYRLLGRYMVSDEGVVDWEKNLADNSQAAAQQPSFNSNDYLAFMRKELLSDDWTVRIEEVIAGSSRYSIAVEKRGVSISHGNNVCLELVARNRQLNVAIQREQGPYGFLVALAVAKSLQAVVVDSQDRQIAMNHPVQLINSCFGQADPEIEETAYELGLLFRMNVRTDASIQTVSF